MMTDGVTECRSKDGFIEQKTVMDIIESVRDQSHKIWWNMCFISLKNYRSLNNEMISHLLFSKR